MRDARDVLPESMIFQYTNHATYAGFANYFRYKLLHERGGWWADTDLVCLRPFDFSEEYVFGSELTMEGESTPTSGFIKAPAGSEAMGFAWEQCLSKDPRQITWGETGALLIADIIRRYSLHAFVQDFRTFTPVVHFEWERVLAPGWAPDFAPSTLRDPPLEREVAVRRPRQGCALSLGLPLRAAQGHVSLSELLGRG